jgi:hypothetical protein
MNALLEKQSPPPGDWIDGTGSRRSPSTLRLPGRLWDVTRNGIAPNDVRFRVDTTREVLSLEFIGGGTRAVLEPARVIIESEDGTLIDRREDPEKSFESHQFETPWDDLHLAYFLGEALWTYLNVPFLHSWSEFVTEEITPTEVGGETWRRLQATFPDHIKSHTRQQISCFGPDGLLRRHDVTIDVVAGAPGELHATDYRNVDGIVIPTTRRAYASRGDEKIVMVAIDMSAI